MTMADAVAKRIIELCSRKEITINKLATLSGLTQSTVDSIINGKSKNPRLETIKKICIGFDMTIVEFFSSPLFDHSNLDD